LKVINLSECDSITNLPELCAPNLEILDLSHCKNLVEIDESIGFLNKLQNWDLTDCENLHILPSSLTLKSLEIFRLEGCSRLEKFPDIQSEMNCLQVLELQKSGIRGLPSSIGYLNKLKCLHLYDCQNLRDLPDSIYKLQQLDELSICTTKLIPTHDSVENFSGYGFPRLKHLHLNDCGNLIELDFLSKPDYFPALKYLDRNGTNIITIPESISKFTKLEGLRIDNCKQLQEIPSLPQSISRVYATNCLSLDPQSSSKLLTQVSLSLSHKEKLLLLFPNTLLDLLNCSFLNLLIACSLEDFTTKNMRFHSHQAYT
jgi:Leucine-rich repeat (LRR) protein